MNEENNRDEHGTENEHGNDNEHGEHPAEVVANVTEHESDPARRRGVRSHWLAAFDARIENDDAAKGRERIVKSTDDEPLVGAQRC